MSQKTSQLLLEAKIKMQHKFALDQGLSALPSGEKESTGPIVMKLTALDRVIAI
jgi:hypothetical protein